MPYAECSQDVGDLCGRPRAEMSWNLGKSHIFARNLDPRSPRDYSRPAMKLPGYITRAVCCFVISMLLFTQAAFAASPCTDPGMSAANAVSQSTDHDCCEGANETPNLCVAMCVDGDRTPAPSYVALPVLGELPLVTVAALPVPVTTLRLKYVAAARPPPPKTIRLCSFLI